MSGREPLSPAEKKIYFMKKTSQNPSHQGTDKVLADVLSAMTQMCSTTLSMETTMLHQRKGGKKPPQLVQWAIAVIQTLRCQIPPNGDPSEPSSAVTEDALLNDIAQDFESDEQTDPKVA